MLFMNLRKLHICYFTMVELLTVISVIIIMTAVLLPSLAKARGKVQQTACMNNLKQLGTGILLYCGDYQDWLPLVDPGNPALPGVSWIYNVPLMEYIGVNKISENKVKLKCPSDQNPCSSYSGNVLTSYCANVNMGSGWYGSYRKILEFADTGKTAWAGESNIVRRIAKNDISYFNYFHSNGMNVLFLDNHVTWRHMRSIPYYVSGLWYPSMTEGKLFWGQ